MLNFYFQVSNLAFWDQRRAKTDPKRSKCTNRSREKTKTIFPHGFRDWLWILHKIAIFCSQGSIIGQNCVRDGPKWTKIIMIGINRQMIPFFSSVWGTEYNFYCKLKFYLLWVNLGTFWIKVGSKLIYEC